MSWASGFIIFTRFRYDVHASDTAKTSFVVFECVFLSYCQKKYLGVASGGAMFKFNEVRHGFLVNHSFA